MTCTTSAGRGQTRIVTVVKGRAGRLEVRNKGVWGTVCHSVGRFDHAAATVFCRMLGHNRSTTPEPVPTAGELNYPLQKNGPWPMWMDFRTDDSCNGTETSIEECIEDPWDHCSHHYCKHTEDVVISCPTLLSTLYDYNNIILSALIMLGPSGHNKYSDTGIRPSRMSPYCLSLTTSLARSPT